MITCNHPPPLDDGALLRYIDQEATQDILDHLAGCPYCLSRANAYRDLQFGLQSQLHRIACPSPEHLGEYQLGLHASAAEQNEVRAHLAICSLCREEVAQLETFMEQPDPVSATALVRRLRTLVATVLPTGGTELGGHGFAYGGVRGESDVALYQAEEYTITLSPENDPRGRNQRQIIGLVMSDTDPAPSGVVELRRQEQVLAQADLIEGNFILGPLTPGNYDLRLATGDASGETEILLNDVAL
ncbi:MAG: hypothetical protein HY326_03255 [Chloroflexi bacterium]|nr:hypothetical protein [Chloroflexota bacterium]